MSWAHQSEAPHLLPWPSNGRFDHLFTAGAILKDTALREQCVAETVWSVLVVESC